MDDTSLYQTRLIELLAQVTADLKTLGIQNMQHAVDWIPTENAPIGSDQNTVADSAEEFEEKEAILAQLETRYNDIERALAHIEAGTYGVCEVCQKNIEHERLNADPAVHTCSAHKEGSLAH